MDLAKVSELTDAAVARGTLLPQAAYTSPEWLAAEQAPIFDRRWTFVGHASEFAPGTFRRMRVGTEDMVVTRNQDGAVHALHNVCRHRAAEVVTEDCGTARSLVCPYHLWSYDLTGNLKVAHGMPTDVSLSDFPLKSRPVREWHGLLFIVPEDADDDASTFAPFSRDLDEFARLRLHEAKVVHTEVYDIAANWKAVWENFCECYHCSTNHPEFLAAYDLDSLYDENGETGIVRLKDGMCSLSLDGQPVCKRAFGDFDGVPTEEWGLYYVDAYPAYTVSATPDYAVIHTFTPTSAGRTVLKCDWLVHRDAVEGVDYEIKDVVVVWHQTNLQDIALCESAQRGISSSAYQPGLLSAMREPFVVRFHEAYAQWLRGGLAATASTGT
ncbi:MAG TPA: aromatic ring-hydroxylating dioxygenase subunit alpha [Nocardioidaceae bacterium]|nr:aromatic ring-hydroxylating dioxygenase subunit alpha [Nocardioidaceae bacterium]